MQEPRRNKVAPLSIFISYAHEDELLRQRLEAHLSLLRRQGLIADWHDRQILAGDEWARSIDQHLEAASIILLLISADFVASDYCYDQEMKRALERHQRGEARVIPIILRPCDWQTSPFAHLQCLPRDGKAVTTWQNQDGAFLAVAHDLRRVIEQQSIPTRPLPEVERKNRRSLIKRVRTTWIEGVLEHSLHQASLIALNLQEQPDALANPWQLEVQETNLPPHPLPAGIPLVQVYDEAEGELLILGEPGAGKTTLLLELARTLLNRAEEDERERIPVVFHLSSWAEKRSPLSEWLVEELGTKYQVPRKIGQSWVTSDQLLPLLDGLDEMGEDVRPTCVQAINTYRQNRLEAGSSPLVVCCRSEEYLILPTRVNLYRAVSIQPLTDDQIERHLQSTKGQLEQLRQALHHDPELYELVHRPLMLSIFTLAYQGAGPQKLPTGGTSEAQQRQVFATYVERMLSHRGISRHASRGQMLRWLMFLATQMQWHHQTVFFLEYLQPDWLEARSRRFLYGLSVVLIGGLISGLPLALVILMLSGWSHDALVSMLTPLFCGTVGGLIYGERLPIRPGEVLTWSWKKARWMTVGGLLGGLVYGWAIWLFVELVDWLFGRLKGGLIMINGLVYGLIGMLASGLVVGLLGRIAFGVSTRQLDERLRLRPNQGIWRSVRNGLLVIVFRGLFIWLVLVLVSSLPSVLLYGPGGFGYGVFNLLFAVLLFVLLLGPSFVLKTFLQHFTLRFWLWCAGSLPWNMITFLDEADERLLLRKVGGGYIFVHRLLLDYFASLEKKEP